MSVVFFMYKIFECFINKQIVYVLEDNVVISDSQYNIDVWLREVLRWV